MNFRISGICHSSASRVLSTEKKERGKYHVNLKSRDGHLGDCDEVDNGKGNEIVLFIQRITEKIDVCMLVRFWHV
jgi:hypothetical protein